MAKDDRFDFFGFDGLTADQLRAMGMWFGQTPCRKALSWPREIPSPT